MKQRHFLYILCLFTAFSRPMAVADDSAAYELRQQVAKIEKFSANFQQVVKDANGETIQVSEGMLTLVRPDRLRWEVTAPDPSLLIADGQALWYRDDFVEQVTVTSLASAMSNNPFLLLTSEEDNVWSMFTIARQDERFVVTPKENASSIQTLELSFVDNRLASLTTMDTQSQRSTMTFSNVSDDMKISEQLFLMSIPDGYQLDDQR